MRKVKGSALISALFIMTLVAIAATAMSIRLQLDIYRTRISLASDKLYLAAQAVPFWGLSELANPDWKMKGANEAGKLADFPANLRGIYPGIQIQGALYDLQARFNLNNVADKKYVNGFQELLKHGAKNLEQKQREQLSLVLNNWLKPYLPGQDAALNMGYYLKQKPPYYPAQQFMQNSSEFRLLMGVDPKLYLSMQNYLVALPDQTPINFNSASRTVLSSLGFGLTDAQVNELIEARGKSGISDLAKLNELLQKSNIRAEQVTLESQFFLAVAKVSSEDLNLTSYTVLKRKKNRDGKVMVSLLSESINSFQ